MGYDTLGESTALRKTIDRFLSQKDYQMLQDRRKEVIVACQQPEEVEYFSNSSSDFEDFKDFMWASPNSPIAMTILRKGDRDYTDGGVTELLSLVKIIQLDATEVDVFIHRPRPEAGTKTPTRNVIHNFFRLFSIMRKAIEKEDLELGIAYARAKNIKVNVCWLPRQLSEHSLMFDQKVMRDWVDEGIATARDPARWDHYDFSRQGNPINAPGENKDELLSREQTGIISVYLRTRMSLLMPID